MGANQTSRHGSPDVSEGVNLRKEAEKLDIKQFNSSDVAQVIPMMAVMRPPDALNDRQNSNSRSPESKMNNKSPLLQGKQKYLTEKEKEALRNR